MRVVGGRSRRRTRKERLGEVRNQIPQGDDPETVGGAWEAKPRPSWRRRKDGLKEGESEVGFHLEQASALQPEGAIVEVGKPLFGSNSWSTTMELDPIVGPLGSTESTPVLQRQFRINNFIT